MPTPARAATSGIVTSTRRGEATSSATTAVTATRSVASSSASQGRRRASTASRQVRIRSAPKCSISQPGRSITSRGPCPQARHTFAATNPAYSNGRSRRRSRAVRGPSAQALRRFPAPDNAEPPMPRGSAPAEGPPTQRALALLYRYAGQKRHWSGQVFALAQDAAPAPRARPAPDRPPMACRNQRIAPARLRSRPARNDQARLRCGLPKARRRAPRRPAGLRRLRRPTRHRKRSRASTTTASTTDIPRYSGRTSTSAPSRMPGISHLSRGWRGGGGPP